jgi:hypothetical protein
MWAVPIFAGRPLRTWPIKIAEHGRKDQQLRSLLLTNDGWHEAGTSGISLVPLSRRFNEQERSACSLPRSSRTPTGIHMHPSHYCTCVEAAFSHRGVAHLVVQQAPFVGAVCAPFCPHDRGAASLQLLVLRHQPRALLPGFLHGEVNQRLAAVDNCSA